MAALADVLWCETGAVSVNMVADTQVPVRATATLLRLRSSPVVPAARNSRAAALVETAVSDSATTSVTVRERPARLYTGKTHPLVMMSAVGKKGSTHLADTAEGWLSCQRHGGRQWCAAILRDGHFVVYSSDNGEAGARG